MSIIEDAKHEHFQEKQEIRDKMFHTIMEDFERKEF